MKTLHRYILTQQIPPFLFGIFVIIFILILDFLYKNLEILIGKGIPFLVSAELLVLSLGWMIVMAVPMAVLIGTLISFMRLASDNEITAMRTSGLSLVSISRPLIIASFVLSLLMIPVHNYLVPETNHRLANLLVAIHKKKPAMQLRDGVFMNDVKGYSILVNKSTGSELEGVTISRLIEGKPAQTIRADRGEIFFAPDGVTLVMKLYDGEIHDVDQKDPKRYLRLKFTEHTLYIPDAGSELVRADRDYRGDREMSINDLLAEMNRYKGKIVDQGPQVTKIVKETAATFPAFLAAAASAGETGEAAETGPAGKTGEAGKNGETRAAGEAVDAREAGAVQKVDLVKSLNTATDKLKTLQIQIESYERRIRSLSVEAHKKVAISFACVVFVLIGIPIGIRTKEGGAGSGLVVSILFFAIYYAFLSSGEKLADRGYVFPSLAMWAANLLLGAVGIYLFIRANRELPFFPQALKKAVRSLRR
jgi:lipopolysaccharide export system permease protein